MDRRKVEERLAGFGTPGKGRAYGLGQHQLESAVEHQVADKNRRHRCNSGPTLDQRTPGIQIHRGGRQHAEAGKQSDLPVQG